MGHRKMSVPRHGSLGVRPRKRAASIVPRVRSWVKLKEPQLLGFPAYKVGMFHSIMRDNYPTSPTYGREVFRAMTLLEAPPVVLVALRLYGLNGVGGVKTIGEVWAKSLPKNLGRILTPPKRESGAKEGDSKVSDEIDVIINELKKKAVKATLLVATQPEKTGSPKKTPEIVELPLGGQLDEQLEYLRFLGKEITAEETFSPPKNKDEAKEKVFVPVVVDAVAVSRGKGYEGPVARFGVKIIQKKKAKKTKRGPGSDSPLTPSAVMSTVPRAGQMGFHNRVDLNKIVVKIEPDPAKFVPKAGFKHYGVPKSPLIVVQGSVPGASKRLVVLRRAVRSYVKLPKESAALEYVSTK
jgi:large subunit ribosomal protein L3